MLSEKMLKAMNEQIVAELYSAYMYLAMSAQFEAEALPGFARWTRLQAEEETEHAMKFFDFINDRGGRVTLGAIDMPPTEYGGALSTFEIILGHEQKVTSLINRLYQIALDEKDFASQIMLHWFIDEQVEEEKNAQAIVDQLKMAGDRPGNLMYVDRHVGKREEE